MSRRCGSASSSLPSAGISSRFARSPLAPSSTRVDTRACVVGAPWTDRSGSGVAVEMLMGVTLRPAALSGGAASPARSRPTQPPATAVAVPPTRAATNRRRVVGARAPAACRRRAAGTAPASRRAPGPRRRRRPGGPWPARRDRDGVGHRTPGAQVGEQHVQVGLRAGRHGAREPVVELGRVEPAGGEVLGQRVAGGGALGLADAEGGLGVEGGRPARAVVRSAAGGASAPGRVPGRSVRGGPRRQPGRAGARTGRAAGAR